MVSQWVIDLIALMLGASASVALLFWVLNKLE